MCGRAHLSTDFSEIKLVFNLPPDQPVPNFAPTYNLAPTDPIPVIRRDPETRARRLDVIRWGLIPYFWHKTLKELKFTTINAKAEGIETASFYRLPFRQRRCLIPLDGFYEWKKLGPDDKQPYSVGLKGGGLMAVAGLWDRWQRSSEMVHSATIITCPPNSLCAELHDRMPVILPLEAWSVWLGEERADTERLKALLVPYPSGGLTMWPVDRRVGNVKNNDPSLVEPVAE